MEAFMLNADVAACMWLPSGGLDPDFGMEA